MYENVPLIKIYSKAFPESPHASSFAKIPSITFSRYREGELEIVIFVKLYKMHGFGQALAAALCGKFRHECNTTLGLT